MSSDAYLSRAKIIRLTVGNKVHRHIDRGEYCRLHDRYLLAFTRSERCSICIDGQTVEIHQGDLWWFNNKKSYEIRNNGPVDWIYLLFDLLPSERYYDAFPSKRPVS